jgi:hypothetical protein
MILEGRLDFQSQEGWVAWILKCVSIQHFNLFVGVDHIIVIRICLVNSLVAVDFSEVDRHDLKVLERARTSFIVSTLLLKSYTGARQPNSR